MRESIIEHKSNMFYVELREDYLRVCQRCSYQKQVKGQVKSKSSPYCKAFILSIMENWTNNKRGSGRLAVFMSYRQWSDEMYGMFGRTIIIDSVDELIGEGLLSREAYKMTTGQDTFQYSLNYKEVNKRIRDLPEGESSATRPKVDEYPSKSKPVPVQKETGTRPKVDEYPSKSGHNITSTQNQPSIYTEEDASLSSPALIVWTIWCEAQGYIVKRDWTKTERERCIALANMCKEASIDLTPKLMNKVREWAQAKQSFLRNDWALKNLINALPDYFKHASSAVTQQPATQEVPDLTAEEAEKDVLWSRRPSKIFTMIQRGENTIEDHYTLLSWMPRREAREYDYDQPGTRHYTSEEIERYKQLTGQQEVKRLRLL